MNWQNLDLTISGLKKHYANSDFLPEELIEYLNQQIDEYLSSTENAVWLYRLSKGELQSYLDALVQKDPNDAPLWGVPFAIKDNIDLAGVPTTASCPAFAYTAHESAFVVQKLIEAGAIPLGKTNLDQFATGLVGVRSPYGICKNALNEQYISGGSSSGSAVAVAKHWVSFSLGTDTAGSGRVPAALNNIVGLKPTKGLLSTTGLVPACRSLDCISVFALNTDDANTVLNVAAQFDASDAYARANNYNNSKRFYSSHSGKLKVGVPKAEQLKFFEDQEAQALFNAALADIKADGAEVIEIDFSAFVEAAELLYQGPWVAERYLAAQKIIETNIDDLLPVIKTIVGAGDKPKAIDAFAAQYKLQACAQKAKSEMAKVDVIVTPTNGTAYTTEQVLNDPIALNSNLGYYTNYMNLLDFAAVAIPHGFKSSGIGCGLTLFSHAFSDKSLLGIGARWQNIFKLKAGESSAFYQQGCNIALPSANTVDVVVCGAHLEGLPLNWQLTERGAELKQATTTSENYKLYALPGGPPLRPALVRAESGGSAIQVEVWRLPMAEFGSFVAAIPEPLGIGKVQLADGLWYSGFICDGIAIGAATDITEFGGWRDYLSNV